jgi:hypothetical protein
MLEIIASSGALPIFQPQGNIFIGNILLPLWAKLKRHRAKLKRPRANVPLWVTGQGMIKTTQE